MYQLLEIDKVHSLFLMFSWGLWLDIGIIVAKTFRSRRTGISYQVFHGVLMTILVIATGIGIYFEAANDDNNPEQNYTHTNIHIAIGYTILTLSIIQLILGPIISLRIRSYHPDLSYLTIKSLHKANGYLLYGLSRFNILWGSYFFGGMLWFAAVVAYQVILFSWAFNYKRVWLRESMDLAKKSPYKAKESDKSEHLQLIKDIEEGMTRAKLKTKYPNVNWVIYGNRVYDLTGWIHPGGNFIIAEAIGREVSRFVHGAYGLETMETLRHTHSIYAFNLLETFYIGQLSNLGSIVSTAPLSPVKKPSSKEIRIGSMDAKANISVSLMLDNDSFVLQQRRWKLINKSPIFENIARFDFESPNIKMDMFGSDLSSFGRCFLVGFPDKFTPIRPYTHCTALVPEYQELREAFLKYFEAKIKGDEAELSFDPEKAQPRNYLSLIIKNYKRTIGFSKQIHDVDPNKNKEAEFIIQGPIGRGLGLNQATTGTFYIICAGTGILPFIDLLNFMLWKNIYDVMVKKKLADEKLEGKLKEVGLNVKKGFKKNFKLRLVGAFSSSHKCLGVDIIKKLIDMNKKYECDNFQAEMSSFTDDLIEKTPQTINIDYLRRRVFTDAEVYWVCGPPKFNSEMINNLKNLGISPDRILLV